MTGARRDDLTLVLVAGLPGAGKSSLSLALGRALGWPVVDKDIFEAVLRSAGIGVANPTTVAYDLMFALTRDLLAEQHRSVILDCPAVFPERVEQAAGLARSAGARFTVMLCLATREVRNERMARCVPASSRTWRHPARRRPSDIAGDGRAEFAHLPAETLPVQTDRPLDAIVADVLPRLLGENR